MKLYFIFVKYVYFIKKLLLYKILIFINMFIIQLDFYKYDNNPYTIK